MMAEWSNQNHKDIRYLMVLAHQSVSMDVTAPTPSLVTKAAEFLTPSYHNVNVILASLVYRVW